MKTSKNIAVLITSFNRSDKTLQCIDKLLRILPTCSIYLVDDSSKDDTVRIISTNFPNVKIIYGTGDLFWNRGMHLAWEHTNKLDYDFYLWLNDDVVLYENSIQEIFECSKINNHQAIISGLIESEDKQRIIYGGTNSNKNLIKPNDKMNPITNMNGNVVLIPKYVHQLLGNLDPVYHHDLGDVDYGLRAKNKGIGVYTTRVVIARGESNDICRVRLNNVNIYKRFKRLYSPLGSNPRIIFYFRRKHYGYLNATIYFIFLHFLNILPDSMNKLIFKQRYI